MSSRYLTIPTTKTPNGITIYQPTYYPSIEETEDDIYIIAGYQDRFDLIAVDFYGDESDYWVIPMVNNLECDSMFPPIGMQLRIPKNIDEIKKAFIRANEI